MPTRRKKPRPAWYLMEPTVSRGYERLVQEVYEALLRQEEFPNVKVQHDVKLVGRSGAEHQVDVYWEFIVVGVRYRTCIECRYHRSRIKKSAVAAFSRILADLDGAKGIMVTSAGFQTGAQRLAAEDGIRLVRIDFLFQKRRIILAVTAPSFSSVGILFDPAHVERLTEAQGGVAPRIEIDEDRLADFRFVDDQGCPAESLMDLLNQDQEAIGSVVIRPEKRYVNSTAGPVRVLEVRGDRAVHEDREFLDIIVEGEQIARAIIEDLGAGGVSILNADGTITSVERGKQ